MKHIITAIALLAASAMPALAGEAAAQAQIKPLDRTQEYRMWSAERMIERVVARLGRMNAGCNDYQVRIYFPKTSEACENAVMSMYPQLKFIREVAASGDEVLWVKIIDVVHKLEADTDAPLHRAEQRK